MVRRYATEYNKNDHVYFSTMTHSPMHQHGTISELVQQITGNTYKFYRPYNTGRKRTDQKKEQAQYL